MAAPTPISSLVHSSTLVTAGLYLIMRFSCFIYQLELVSFCLYTLFWLGLFTSLYAGLCSLFEPDLKKLVALSTLRHLGFICLAFSIGRVDLAYFHLLSHALFKSLLFIGLGNVLSGRSHIQDSRFLSSGLILMPASSGLIIVSIINLFGLPFVRGFYSKDLVLEFVMFNPVCRNLRILILYLNVLLTFSYTFRVLINLSSQIKISHSFFPSLIRESVLHFNYLSVLAFLSVTFITF
jgi:NADH-ubiquinone oxidoreductase chain 5